MKNVFFVLLCCLLLCSFGNAILYSQNYGDANEDGSINIIDALITAQHYVGLNPDPFNNANADVDGQNGINIIDALLIAQYYVGLITQFPAQSEDIEIIKSIAEWNENPVLETGELEELVYGNTSFALDFYHAISDSDDNLIFSPYSISVAFAMCYAGAKNATEVEIEDILSFTLGQSNLHNAFNALDIELKKPGNPPSGSTGDQFTLRITNSTWGQKDYPFLQDYLDVLAINYAAGLYTLNFAENPDGSRIIINNWVSDQTEQKINDLLPPGSIDALTRFVLTNAIYFKASWADKFNPANTVPETFTLLDGSTKTVQMMKKTDTLLAEEVTGEYKIASLSYYGGKASMVIILPESGRFKTIESSLTPDTLTNMISSIIPKTLSLSMPKFNFGWGDSIKAVLVSLGMMNSFSIEADFTGITTYERLMIGDVFHKAMISVDERGTEAAAATAIVMPPTGPEPPPPMTMELSRPFIFVIRENTTGTILFAGRVMDTGE